MLERLLHRWERKVSLSDGDRAAVGSLPLTPKAFGRDGYIVREGDPTTNCCLVLSGFAFRQKLLRNGSRQIISIHIASEFVDLQNSLLGMADHSVQSLNQSAQNLQALVVQG